MAILLLDKTAVVDVFTCLLSAKPKTNHLVNGDENIDSQPSSFPPPVILHILNGLESLECLVSANPRSSPEYFEFFKEMKPTIRCAPKLLFIASMWYTLLNCSSLFEYVPCCN